MKETILPKINAEVNTGKNFATLRQIYHSVILGLWFKEKFKQSVYQHYIDKGKISGIDITDKGAKDKIYNLYVEAFKKGIYNYIKPEKELASGKRIKRQYFSGGCSFIGGLKTGVPTTNKLPEKSITGSAIKTSINLNPEGDDAGIARSSIKEAEKRKRINELKEKISGIEKINLSFNKLIERYSSEIGTTFLYKDIIRDLEKKIANNQQQIEEYRRELNSLSETKEKSAGSAISKPEDVKVKELEKKIDEIQEANAHLKVLITRYSSKIGVPFSSENEKNEAIQVLGEKIEDSQKQIEEYLQEVDSLLKTKEKSAGSAISKSEDVKVKELEKKIDEIQEANAHLKVLITRYSSKIGVPFSSENERKGAIQALREKIANNQEQIKKYQQELDFLKEILKIASQILPQINEEITKLRGLTQEEALGCFPGNKFAKIGFDPENRLGWTLSALKEILKNPKILEQTFEVAEDLCRNFKYIIFSGMGGSGLSMQVVKTTFDSDEGPRMYSLRTTDAGVIKEIIDGIIHIEGEDIKAVLEKIAFVSTTKTFITAETLSHQEYMENLFTKYHVTPVKGQFTIYTDPTNDPKKLEKWKAAMGKGYIIRPIQLNDNTDVGGRFTAPTTNVFLLPLAVRKSREDVIKILNRAVEMNDINDTKEDIFGLLGIYLDYMDSKLGKDKLTVYVPDELRDIPGWLEQLCEESTGKDGKGISIIYGERLSMKQLRAASQSDRVFLRINIAEKETNKEFIDQIRVAGHPVFDINLKSINDIAGLMLGLERAISVYSYQQDINFVNQPGVEGYKKGVRKVLAELSKGEKVRVPEMAYAVFGSLKIYYAKFIEAGIATKEEIEKEVSGLGKDINNGPAVYATLINIALRKAKENPEKYGKFEVAEIATYGKMNEEFRKAMEEARFQIFTDGLKMASKLGEGPDKNHSYQQMVAQGKNYYFSTYLKSLQTEQSQYMEYNTNVNDAIPLGTTNSLAEVGRKVVLITMDNTISNSVNDIRNFFAEVSEYVDYAASVSSALSLEQKKGYLLLAENEIKKYLNEQFKNNKIIKDVYEKAIQNTCNNLKAWATDKDIKRLSPKTQDAIFEAIRKWRWEDIVEVFRQDITFGTAGIRGKAALIKEELYQLKEEGPQAKILKGPNTINDVVLLRYTTGVAKYAKENNLHKIAIGYDSRIAGEQFAELIAQCFIGQSNPGYKFIIYLFDEASPFPELSFGLTTESVRADLGILISASHNPADYNGYKVTDGTGSQLPQRMKDNVKRVIDATTFADIKLKSLAEAEEGHLIWLGGKEPLAGKDYKGVDLNKYFIDMHTLHIKQVKKFILDKKIVERQAANVKIGFSAFNGAGYKAVPRLLQELGFINRKSISKLQQLDGLFPVFGWGEQPDPGDPIAADIAVREFIAEYGQKAFDELDILIGTDPDADRMGLIVKVPENQQHLFGKYRLLSANDTWTLLIWYRLIKKQELGLLKDPGKHYITFSHVTTDALEATAGLFGVPSLGEMHDKTDIEEKGHYLNGKRSWVGFTYIADFANKMREKGLVNEAGAEESNGFSILGGRIKGGEVLADDAHVNDKDGTLAALLLAEVACYAKENNTTIFELLDNIYLRTGHYATANKPLPRVGSFEGAEGVTEKINLLKKAQEWLREANGKAGTDTPFVLGGLKVTGAIEFKSGRYDAQHYPGFPDEGIRFFFEDNTLRTGELFYNSKNFITIRPSGTSQAIRFYTQRYSKVSKDAIDEQKFQNYFLAEKLALEVQKELLMATNITKYVDNVEIQLNNLNKVTIASSAFASVSSAAKLSDDNQSRRGGIDLTKTGVRAAPSSSSITAQFAEIARRLIASSGITFQIIRMQALPNLQGFIDGHRNKGVVNPVQEKGLIVR
ncbi:MAG: hypothetical protein QMD94_03130 [Candidatus Omnitrophota bacterium]|nr:hypothetical protein [Candidatus Omnitrophota bacterium]